MKQGIQVGFAAVVLLASIHVAQAVVIPDPLGGKTFQDLVGTFVGFAETFLAPLATIMVLLAGFFYMTAGGNPEKIKRAHKTLLWALAGIAVVLLAEVACSIIATALGAACP